MWLGRRVPGWAYGIDRPVGAAVADDRAVGRDEPAGRVPGLDRPGQDFSRAAPRQQQSSAPSLTYAGKRLHNVRVVEDDAVFKALADPTRRALLDRLRE